jgi:uncharacterized Tic20 family protein
VSYSPPPPGPASWPGGPVGTTSEERNWAVAAHVGVFVAWLFALAILAPLLVLLVKGKESPFVRSHAVESLNFQITSLIVGVVGVVLSFVIVGFFLLAGWFLFYVVVVIVATVAASNGREYRYPLTLRLVS